MDSLRHIPEAYVSYSHKDSKQVEQLLLHLAPLEKDGLLRLWHDKKIGPGQMWDKEIHSHLERADIFLLMLSPNYLASDFCREIDMGRALYRLEKDGARVVPIILSPCDWMRTPLGKLMALPTRGKPVSQWNRRADAYADVAQGVRYMLQSTADDYAPVTPPSNPPNPTKGVKKTVAQKKLTGKLTGETLIIHGHATQERYELRDFIQNTLGLPRPVVMADAVNPGKTLPEKFAALAGEVEFAVALLTPDDKGKATTEQSYQQRARQNVLVEIGWFWGRLGLDRVLLIVKDKVEIPSDLDGLEYYKFKNSPLELSEKIRDFYRAHGVTIR